MSEKFGSDEENYSILYPSTPSTINPIRIDDNAYTIDDNEAIDLDQSEKKL